MRRRLLQALLFAAAALAGYAGWWLYDLGKVHGVDELGSLRTMYRALQDQHDRTVSERDALRDRVAILERSSQVDRQAAQAVRDELGELQEELQAAREEVRFYRGIVSPGEDNEGLRIHSFSLAPALQPGEYEYDLVLTQLKRNDRFVSGKVAWRLIGTQGGEVSELDLAAVTEPATDALKFRFRYFQHLAGMLRLPEGFLPHRLELTVTPAGKKAPEPVQAVYDWPAVAE
jgi:hypothetical protein